VAEVAEPGPVEPISGYADAAKVFGVAADADSAGPGTGDVGSAGDGDTPTTDAGDGTAGSSRDGAGDADSPALVDVCAVEEPSADCEGVAGTVTLATIEAFRFNFDPALSTTWPCESISLNVSPASSSRPE